MAPSPGFDLGYHPGRGQNVQDAAATLAVGGSVLAPVAVGAADDKTVLLIYAEAQLIPAIITADQIIRSTIQSGNGMSAMRVLRFASAARAGSACGCSGAVPERRVPRRPTRQWRGKSLYKTQPACIPSPGDCLGS